MSWLCVVFDAVTTSAWSSPDGGVPWAATPPAMISESKPMPQADFFMCVSSTETVRNDDPVWSRPAVLSGDRDCAGLPSIRRDTGKVTSGLSLHGDDNGYSRLPEKEG